MASRRASRRQARRYQICEILHRSTFDIGYSIFVFFSPINWAQRGPACFYEPCQVAASSFYGFDSFVTPEVGSSLLLSRESKSPELASIRVAQKAKHPILNSLEAKLMRAVAGSCPILRAVLNRNQQAMAGQVHLPEEFASPVVSLLSPSPNTGSEPCQGSRSDPEGAWP